MRRALTELLAISWPLLCLVSPAFAQDSPEGDDVDFAREVRPLLSKRCFACHGPDEETREGGLRLDTPEGSADGLPTELREEIHRRITAAPDDSDRMPPMESGEPLTRAESATLATWLDGGARYAEHWAFVPPRRPEPPAPRFGAEHPIDRFIDERLHGAGLEPAPRADRATLIRRAYGDLLGLVPTLDEVERFTADERPDAWPRLIDRLLASPHYGERMARRWLDLARYADTNGYEKDRPRTIWPYRDQVIRSFNEDAGFDDFVIEQLAGDMLPNATPEQIIASGFHRNTMLNEEGGIDPLEFRYYAVVDRINTTGTALLGLTVGCAQCHTHKFDPLTHSEYFGLLAFLDQADEPEYVVPDGLLPAATRAGARSDAAIERAEAALHAAWPDDATPLDRSFATWLDRERALARAADWQTLQPTQASSNLPRLEIRANGTIVASGDTTKHDVYRIRLVTGDIPTGALRLEALPDASLPAGGPGLTYYEGTPGDFFLTELRLRAEERDVAVRQATVSYAKNRFGKAAVGGSQMLDGDLQTGWSVHGRIGERHVAVFELGEPLPPRTELELELHFGRHFSSSLGRLRFSAAETPSPARAWPPELAQLLQRAPDSLLANEREQLLTEFLLQAEEVTKAADRLRRARRGPNPVRTLVLRERPRDHRRTTRRHHRGEFLQPREVVEPHTPTFLHDWPVDLPRDRLGFARWLTSPDSPLFARVVVNRHWALLFGTGLVRTLDDFGAQGEPPSHPRLLDWLATEFVASDFRLKDLHRLILTSATYQRAATVDPTARAVDPNNRLLAYAPRFRRDAEFVRDAALRAAGVLDDRLYGPPVRPPQPAGITEVAFGRPRWNASKGADRRRRSLYTFHKRTAPYAFLQTFDAPSGEQCIARRDRSNTALQALALLNDPQMLEIAQHFGKALTEHEEANGSLDETLRFAFRRALTREPDAGELQQLTAFVTAQAPRFTADPEGAMQVAGIAKTEGLAVEHATRRAAWTSLARALFALDEFLSRP